MNHGVVCRAGRHLQFNRASRPRVNTPHQVPRAVDNVVRQRLQHSLAVKEQVVDSMLAVCPALACEQQLVTENLDVLQSLPASSQQIRRLVLSTPQLLAKPLQAWHDFLAAYGLHSSQIWRLLVNQPQLLLQGSIFGAGRAILFLKQLGWSDLEISMLVIRHPQHATILLMDVERHLQPVLLHLTSELGFGQQEAASLLHRHPSLLYSSNYRAQAQQLLRQQALGQLAAVV